jgi:hypothetical protein
MTEAPEQVFGKIWTAKEPVVAYGASEFEEESSFTTTPSSSASWTANPRLVTPSETQSQDYVHVLRVAMGSGKSHMFLTYVAKPLGIFPATVVTSRETMTLNMVGQARSMATQQPPATEDETIEEIIWRVGTTLSARYRAKLTSRLSELQNAVQEEELDSRGITVRSLQHFIELLKAYPRLRCPAVSVTPDRNIYASWKSGSDRVFSIHFLPDGKARFVIFCPNEKHPGETIRLSGTATVDVVMSIAEPHGVLNWASDERPDDPRF